MNKPKIDYKKVKIGDEGTAFKAIAEAYKEYMEGLEKFHELSPNEQREFIAIFGKDINAVLLILQEYVYQRTDDVTDRGNQI